MGLIDNDEDIYVRSFKAISQVVIKLWTITYFSKHKIYVKKGHILKSIGGRVKGFVCNTVDFNAEYISQVSS